MTERTPLEQLATDLEATSCLYHGRKIRHVATGGLYRIVGVHYRESDMALCVEYTPLRSGFYNRVKFARSVPEMNFWERFVFVDER